VRATREALDGHGARWWWSLQMEQLGRNLATAGGLELAFRLGLSHDAIERAGRRRTRQGS
jgi:hypothetical protein